MQYALYFVPHKLEREKLALLRRQLCKRFENRKAVMYPVHLTLVRSFTFRDYKMFIADLEKFCEEQKPVRLRLADRLTSRQGWGGIEVSQSEQLMQLQRELVALCARHGKVQENDFDPHISLVYARQLPSLSNRTSPVKKFVLDRVSLIIQTLPGQPYRIAKHVPLAIREEK